VSAESAPTFVKGGGRLGDNLIIQVFSKPVILIKEGFLKLLFFGRI
jgi:hypothetical protein